MGIIAWLSILCINFIFLHLYDTTMSIWMNVIKYTFLSLPWTSTIFVSLMFCVVVFIACWVIDLPHMFTVTMPPQQTSFLQYGISMRTICFHWEIGIAILCPSIAILNYLIPVVPLCSVQVKWYVQYIDTQMKWLDWHWTSSFSTYFTWHWEMSEYTNNILSKMF